VNIVLARSGDGRYVVQYQQLRQKRKLITTLAPSDVAGVTSIVNARVTADGKTYGYSFFRELSDLFLVDGVR